MNASLCVWRLCTIDWSALGIWISAGAELLVALVILYEVEQQRRSSFLEEASQIEPFDERTSIFAAFLDASGTTASEKSEAFCESLWKDPTLRKKCDRQIVLFTRLGHLLTPRLFSWIVSNESILGWFPQSAAILWLILRPYIQERRRRSGRWWAKEFERFVAASVDFLFRNGVETLQMYHPERSNSLFPISKEELRRIQTEISG